jgi:hypothetical protein
MTGFHLTLARCADEVVGTLARLFAYVGTLALLAILGLAALGQLPDLRGDDQPQPRPGWSPATRSHPAFAVSRLDSADRPVSYTILRHPAGGRRDVLRWSDGAGRPMAELDIYRPGGELDPSRPPGTDMVDRIGLGGAAPLEPAGLIDSKFGPVALFRASGRAPSCLGYVRQIEDPPLQISGWSCRGDSVPARRAAIACMLDRLVLLTSGNEPRLAELFAQAELRRRSCGRSGATDWWLDAANARLRGAL